MSSFLKAYSCIYFHSFNSVFLLKISILVLFKEERIFHSFGLRHDDAEIRLLKTELSELLCENTDMKEFVALVRASNKSDCESKSRDMSPVAIKTFRFSSRTLRKVKAC